MNQIKKTAGQVKYRRCASASAWVNIADLKGYCATFLLGSICIVHFYAKLC